MKGYARFLDEAADFVDWAEAELDIHYLQECTELTEDTMESFEAVKKRARELLEEAEMLRLKKTAEYLRKALARLNKGLVCTEDILDVYGVAANEIAERYDALLHGLQQAIINLG